MRMKKDKFISLIDSRILTNGICHRGLHDGNKTVDENSIEAFKASIDNNLPFEFDIHLTKDNKLVVIHDSSLERVTSKEGIVEELTLNEIQSQFFLTNSKYPIPSFKEVLELVDEKVPIVIELKVYKSNFYKLYKEFIKELYESRKDKGNNTLDTSKYLVISFDPRVLKRLRYRKYKLLRQLLICEKKSFTYLVNRMFESIDIEYTLLRKKRYQKYLQKYFVNTYTVNSTSILDEVTSIKCDYECFKVSTVTFELVDKIEVESYLKR